MNKVILLIMFIVLVSSVSAYIDLANESTLVYYVGNDTSGNLTDYKDNSLIKLPAEPYGNPAYRTPRNVNFSNYSVELDGSDWFFYNSSAIGTAMMGSIGTNRSFGFGLSFSGRTGNAGYMFGPTNHDGSWHGFSCYHGGTILYCFMGGNQLNTAITLNRNYTVAAYWNTSHLLMYLKTDTDGIPVEVGTPLATAMNAPESRPYIGTYNEGAEPYTGQLSEMWIYNDTMTERDIFHIMSNSLRRIPVVDITPPTNSSWNVTSNNTFFEDSSSWNNGGTVNLSSNLLTLTVTTDETSNGSCRIGVEQNYTEMVANNSNFKFATTATTSHSYVVFDNITFGDNCLYCSFIDDDGNEPAGGVSSSGCLNVTYWSSMNVTLNQPLNETVSTIKEMIFNFTVVFSNDILNSSLWANFSGTWQLNQTLTVISNNTKTNFSLINLVDGYYIWNVESCSSKICNFSSSNFTLTVSIPIAGMLNATLSPNITDLFYPVNWSKLNLTAVINHTTGNFTWNLTEYNVSAYNLTEWVFNLTNTGDLPINVTLKQNQTKNWYEWWCNNNTIAINITDSPKTLFILTGGQTRFINCTLNVINISETKVNWSVTVDRAIWDFDYIFNKT